MNNYSLQLTENHLVYVLKVLETRPLGEALEVFMSLMKQKQEQDGTAVPAPSLNGGSHPGDMVRADLAPHQLDRSSS